VLLLFIGYPGAPRSNQPCPEVSLTSDEAVKLGLKEQIGSSRADTARYEITPANGCTYSGSSAKAKVRGGFRRGQVRVFQRYQAMTSAIIEVDRLVISAQTSSLPKSPPRTPLPSFDDKNTTLSEPVSISFTWATQDATLPDPG
jgi:hypothetical protein